MQQIIGHSRTISFLQRSLKAGTLAHAYLLIGPPHVGKMTLALYLARALNCESAERPCYECVSCKKIEAANHADVQVTGLTQNDDAAEAKLIHIEQIQDIQHLASLPPFEGKQKVYIIDGAELMSMDAANCLLKTLEEPGEKVTFILLTKNDRLLLPTVVSRCQRMELPPLPGDEITQALIDNMGVDPKKARLLAGFSHGCPGWAITAAGNDSLLEQRKEILDGITNIITAECEERFAYIAPMAARFNQDRTSVYEILDLWLDYWHDLMLVKLGCRDIITNIDRGSELAALSEDYSLGQIEEFVKCIRATAESLHRNANPRLALEVLMLDIPKKKGGSEANRLPR